MNAEYQRLRRAMTQNAICSGARWTKEEDELVIMHIMPDYELSDLLKRSEMAIQMRRFRLHKTNINPLDFKWRNGKNRSERLADVWKQLES